MKNELMESKKGNIPLGGFILMFVTILVGLVFLAPITAAVNDANQNLSTSVSAILDLVPLFYVLALVAVAAIPVIIAFRSQAR